jgi:hypothetical protein
MAEFLTMDEAKSKFGTKGRTSDATSSTSTAEDPTYSR